MIKEITIEPTTLCGANCIMCARHKYVKNPKNMTMDIYMRCIDECLINGYNSFLFGGMGDPLANSNIIEMFRYIKLKSPDSKIRLTTTGQLLEKKLFDDICEYVDVIKFSNYGFTKHTYEKVHRGSLVFEKVNSNIENFLLHDNNKKPYVIMNYLDMPENHHEIEPWLNFWKLKSIDQLDVWKQHNWSGHMGVIDNINERIPCSRVVNKSVAIWVNGDVSICCFDCERKAVLGNLLQNNLENILVSGDVNNYIKIHNSLGSLDGTICFSCDQCYNREKALLIRYVKGELL